MYRELTMKVLDIYRNLVVIFFSSVLSIKFFYKVQHLVEGEGEGDPLLFMLYNLKYLVK